MDPAGRQHAIDAALSRLEALRRPPQAPLSSGSADIDAALGGQGFPRGRLTEIFGPSAAGKTTVALHTAAACQRAGGTAAFVDADHSFDAAYAQALGVNLETLLVAQPDTGEEALSITCALVASGSVDLIVVDSVAALVPRAELEAAAPANLHRRLLARDLRRVARAARRSGACVLLLNQFRQKSGGIGNPEHPTGGPAVGLHSAVRAEVRAIAPLYEGETLAGRRTRFRVVKNTLGEAFREAVVEVWYGRGIVPRGM